MATDDELPGFQAAADIFEIWRSSLARQASTWNSAWRQIKNADYEFKDLIADIAKVHEENTKVVNKIIRYPTATTVNEHVPTWVTFDLRKKFTEQDLSRQVETRTFFTPNINPTYLTQFSPTPGYVEMSVDAIESKSSPPGTDATASSSKTARLFDRVLVTLKTITVNGIVYQLTDEKVHDFTGSYLGLIMIQDPTNRSEPPLAFVTLVL